MTSRGTSPRAHLATAVLALGLLVVVACAPAPASGGNTTVTAQPPLTLPGDAWQSVALPVLADQQSDYAVAPNDPASLFICTVSTSKQLIVWHTQDTGAHWSQTALPAVAGANACEIAIAPENPRRMLILLANAASTDGALMLSDDGGATWRTIPHPPAIPPGTVLSWQQILVSGRAIYVVTSTGTGPQVTQLDRSDDEGASWVRADAPFGPNGLYTPLQLGDGDSLLASVLRQQFSVPANGPELWLTHDGGRAWRQIATLPPDVGTFVLAPRRPGVAPSPMPAAPYYALIGEQVPIGLYRLRVLQSGDGQHWKALPPLPVPGASATRAGYLQALGAAPDGRLLVLGPDPAKGVPTSAALDGPTAAVWLWLWNPRAARWDVLAAPLNVPSGVGCGLCWSSQLATSPDGISYVYVTYADAGSPGQAPSGIFRVRLPAATSR